MISWALALGLLIGNTALAENSNDTLVLQKSRRLTSSGQFYRTGTGNVAFLPKVGNEKFLHRVATHDWLPDSGMYELPRKTHYFFRVNHSSGEVKTSYVGALAFVIFQKGKSNKSELFVRRNKADWKPGPDERKLDAGFDGPKNNGIGLVEFFDAHSVPSVAESDEKLTFTWHAAVSTGQPFSWDFRSKWRNGQPPKIDAFLRELNATHDSVDIAITAHLIQFTSSKSPKESVDFSFSAEEALGVYVLVFSPMWRNFDREFYIKMR